MPPEQEQKCACERVQCACVRASGFSNFAGKRFSPWLPFALFTLSRSDDLLNYELGDDIDDQTLLGADEDELLLSDEGESLRAL